MGFYPITALFFSHCTFQSLFVLLPLASGLLFLCEPTFQYPFGLFSGLFNKYIGPKILLFKYSGGKLLAFCPPPIDKPRQASFACRGRLFSVQHHIPVNFCAVFTVRRQMRPIRPPHGVSAGFISSSQYALPGANSVPPGYFLPPNLLARTKPEIFVLPPRSAVWGNCRNEAGENKTGCSAAARRLQTSASPQHYPILHFPRIFRRDRLNSLRHSFLNSLTGQTAAQ